MLRSQLTGNEFELTRVFARICLSYNLFRAHEIRGCSSMCTNESSKTDCCIMKNAKLVSKRLSEYQESHNISYLVYGFSKQLLKPHLGD